LPNLWKEVRLVSESFAVIGGAGFIGSHFTLELLKRGNSVVAIDNFCSGTKEHIAAFESHPKFSLVELNVEDTDKLTFALKQVETVIHLASNPDIARAATDPRIDFVQGTALTESVVESSRRAKVKSILYASGSGVYGDAGETVLTEKSAINPISTYGASKLAGEALLSSYSFMFGIKSISFRFANVVGDKQTHGVGYDFLRKLQKDKTSLEILGNGEQSKSYVHVSDVISGVLHAHYQSTLINDVYNISTDDSLSVTEIANLALEISGLHPSSVQFNYTGGDRGWKADVPIVRLSAAKLNSIGWTPQFTSYSAMKASLIDMFRDL
jgi:UDP-glucose 4-epimerase